MKIIEYVSLGECPSDTVRLETKDQAQAIITNLIQEVVDRNRQAHELSRRQIKSIVTVVDGEVGIGKSVTLKKYIKDNPDCRSLVFLERKWSVQEYADELGGVAIYSDHKRSSIDVQLGEALSGNEAVVVMTHAALKGMLENNNHLHVFELFDLIAVDETFTSLSIYANDYDSFAEVIGALYLCDTPESDELSSVIKQATKKSVRQSDNEIELLSFSNSQKMIAQRVIEEIKESPSIGENLGVEKIEELVRFLSNIAFDHGRVFYIEKSGNRVHFVSAWSFFPKNRSLIVLADGASKEGAILAMQKYSPDVEVKYERLRHADWSGHTFHIERGASGKYTMNNLSNPDMERLVSLLGETSPGLVLTHQDLAESLRSKESLKKHDIIHWANHRGTNDFSHHNAMYILSLWWQPAAEYSSKYLSEVNKTTYVPGEYEMLDLPVQSLTTEIKQAVGRINRNNEHNHVDIYLRIIKGGMGDTLIRKLQEEFVSASFEEKDWYGLETGSRQRKIDEYKDFVVKRFPQLCFGKAYSLNQLVGERHKRMFSEYRNRNKPDWNKLVQKLKDEDGIICTRFKECSKELDAKGRRLPPATWVLYRE